MSLADKLRLMEALWSELCRNESEVHSPEWHGEILKQREEQISSGEESFLDWETAKKKLREELQ